VLEFSLLAHIIYTALNKLLLSCGNKQPVTENMTEIH